MPNLYLVWDNTGWGYSINVVRAEDSASARFHVCGNAKPNPKVSVELLDPEKIGVLWCHDESPDTGPYG